jgi:hypothetical protein
VDIRRAGYVTAPVCDPRAVDPTQGWTHSNPQRPIRRKVTLGDRRLVEWVAQASVGDQFPEPFSHARSPLESVILTLADLGVMPRPARGTQWPEIVEEATAAAKVWLQANPPRQGPVVGPAPWRAGKPGSEPR